MSIRRKAYFMTLAVALGILLFLLLVGIRENSRFNSTIHRSRGVQSEQCTYSIAKRSGESWIKRDAKIGGATYDLTGTTYDINFYNKSIYEVSNWSIRIDIGKPCYINQNWPGQVEIHQHQDGRPVVQTLSLKSDMTEKEGSIELLHYVCEQDLLIPLNRGDYVVYIPDKSSDMHVEAYNGNPGTVTAGIIFYTLEDKIISETSATYTFARKIYQGTMAIVWMICFLVWLMASVGGLVYVLSYKLVKKNVETRLTGVSVLQDLFDYMYILNIKEGTYEVIKDNKKREKDNIGALFERLIFEADPIYCDAIKEFLNQEDLLERVKAKGSVVFEYKSTARGWANLRFVYFDRAAKKKTDSILFTVRLVNEEHAAREKIEGDIEKLAVETRIKGKYIETMADALSKRSESIIEYNNRLKEKAKGENLEINEMIHSEAMLIDLALLTTKDFDEIIEDRTKFYPVEYTFEKLIKDIEEVIVPLAAKQNVEYKTDTSVSLSQAYFGEYKRIHALIINLLAMAIKQENASAVSLSIFAKNDEEGGHILFSVKIQGGVPLALDSNEIGVANAILGTFRSELKHVYVENEKNEIYFFINQSLVE